MTRTYETSFGKSTWLLVPLVWAISAMALLYTGIGLVWASLLPPLGAGTGLLLLSIFYTSYRPDRTLAHVTEAAAFLFLATPALAMMDYPLQALNFPLWDAEFAAYDAALGFDWLAHLAWLKAHPMIAEMMINAYHSCAIQIILMILVLGWMERPDRLKEFSILFVLTALVVSVFSTLMPAIGAYPFHNPSSDILLRGDPTIGTVHLADVLSLRAGTYKVLDLEHAEGLATLPSFHAVFAILLAWAFRDFPILFWPLAILNAMVLISAVAVGGHYAVDVVAGAAIAGVAMYTYARGTNLRTLLPARSPSATAPASA